MLAHRYYLIVQLDGDAEARFVTHGGFETKMQANEYIKTCSNTFQDKIIIVAAMSPVRENYR